jgi:hypothetical protein
VVVAAVLLVSAGGAGAHPEHGASVAPGWTAVPSVPFAAATASQCGDVATGRVFVTGHDPDFHAVTGAPGSNTQGARNILNRAVEYVTTGAADPALLLVTGLSSSGSGTLDSRQGLTDAGLSFDVAYAGAATGDVLDVRVVDFSAYDAVIVASDFGGWLSQAEVDALNARASAIAAYVGAGGGLVALAESKVTGAYGFLPFLVTTVDTNVQADTVAVTALGTEIGLTSGDVNGSFYHAYFTDPGVLEPVDVDGMGTADGADDRTISLAGRLCSTLTVAKQVVNDDDGTASASAFSIHVRSGGTDVAGSPQAGSADGTTYALAPGQYTVAEDAAPGYVGTVGGDCASGGTITLAAGQDATCTLVNDDTDALPPPPDATCGDVTSGRVFVTGHDPDFHAVPNAPGSNEAGARAILQRAVAYVTQEKVGPSLLLVTGTSDGQTGTLDPRAGLTAAGLPFDVAHAAAASGSVLDVRVVDFADYDAVIVASDFGGWLHQAEVDALNARAADIAAFVGAGGGLVALAESEVTGAYGFLPFLVSQLPTSEQEDTLVVTERGTELGLTNADVNGSFYHAYFTQRGVLEVVDIDTRGTANPADDRAISLAGRLCATLTVVKQVINDNAGTSAPAAFTLHVRSAGADVAGSPQLGSATGTTYALAPGVYTVAENEASGYLGTPSGACAADGKVTLGPGQRALCTIVNDDVAPVETPTPTPAPTPTPTPPAPVVISDPVLLRTAIAVSDPTPALGSRPRATVTVTNGGIGVDGIRVRISLPSGVEYASVPAGCQAAGSGGLSCAVGFLGAGLSWTLTLPLRVELGCDVVGTSKRDTSTVLRSTRRGDVLCGAGAGDRFRGAGGDDRLYGFGPRRTVAIGAAAYVEPSDPAEDATSATMKVGGSGDGGDDIEGGPGDDHIRGQAGDDELVGGGGRDVVKAGGGDDTIDVRDGRVDRVRCGSGRDEVWADGRDDVTASCERVHRR